MLRENPAPLPLCPPQISRGLTGDQTRASAVTGQRLISLDKTRPLFEILQQIRLKIQFVRRSKHTNNDDETVKIVSRKDPFFLGSATVNTTY